MTVTTVIHKCVAAILWCAVIIGGPLQVAGETIECQRTICTRRLETLTCPKSMILVVNVTTSDGQQDDVMLNGLKRFCMGMTSCNLTDVCGNRQYDMAHVVTFLCVHKDKVEDNRCTHAVEMRGQHGFLQSPGYPATTLYRPCYWRIDPEPSTAVHLVLHDLDFEKPSNYVCDGGLLLKAFTCEARKQRYSRTLCANESRRGEGVRVVSCGTVEVELRSARNTYPLRFWISYTVKDSVATEPLLRSLSAAGLVGRCPVDSNQARTGESVYSMVTTQTDVTSTSGVASNEESDRERDNTLTVLIVLVCVVGSIAATLSVILIVVCIRRRRPKVELIEHVYALPSSCEPLSHNLLSSDGNPPHRAVAPAPPPPRPKLIEQYSDVVDAVQAGQEGTPTSPGYAEVECDISSDGGKRKRFVFRQQKQPSVSSLTSNSTTYEDVNPLPQNVNGTVQNSDKTQKKTGDGDTPVSFTSCIGSSDRGPIRHVNDTGRRNVKAPVYVHVEQTSNTNPAQNPSKQQIANNNKQQLRNQEREQLKTKEKDSSSIAPIAAKFSAPAANSPTGNKPTDKRGKTGQYTSRLYPLQEGRVASLVSTLDRGQLKKNTRNSPRSDNRNSLS